jgi:hypothetical protein
MAISQYYVDPSLAGNVGSGTIGDPYGDLQWALNNIVRNAVDGDQVNIQDSAAEVLAASLSLAAYGAPTADAPLALRGYTTTANDGGVGEIDCGGVNLMAASYDNLFLVELEIHTTGAAGAGVELGSYGIAYACEIHEGATTTNNALALLLGSGSMAIGCHVHDYDSAGIVTLAGVEQVVMNNLITDLTYWGLYGTTDRIHIMNNIIVLDYPVGSGAYGIIVVNADDFIISGNITYRKASGDGLGILIGGFGDHSALVVNNIACNFLWGGIEHSSPTAAGPRIIGHNAFYNVGATPSILPVDPLVDLTANDVTLSADPFNDAANGDFSLTNAAKKVLRSAGWPLGYLGADAATEPNITIGPLQYGDGKGKATISSVQRELLG